MGPDERSGEQLGKFTLVDESGTSVDLEKFFGSWLWLIFRRHLG